MSLRRQLVAAAVSLSLSPAVSARTPAPSLADAAPRISIIPQNDARADIVAVLQSSGQFTILLKALAATGLEAALKSAPHLTLFAPTDAAFSALGPARLAALMAPANATALETVLVYHLVDADADLARIRTAKASVASIEAGKLRLDLGGPTPRVNDADIIQADVRASNGVIQVIDKVLTPPGLQLPTTASQAQAFVGRLR